MEMLGDFTQSMFKQYLRYSPDSSSALLAPEQNCSGVQVPSRTRELNEAIIAMQETSHNCPEKQRLKPRRSRRTLPLA